MSARIAAGALSTLVPGVVRVVELPRGTFGAPLAVPLDALVLRDQVGVPRAYLNRCRHLPVPLVVLRPNRAPIMESDEFLTRDGAALLCRTHGAQFRLDDGMCVWGPCQGLPLHALAVEVEGDDLYLIAAA